MISSSSSIATISAGEVADLNAGNLFVMPGGTLAWVDFGLVGWVDERLWAQQFELRSAIASGKLHAAYQCLIATLEPLPPGEGDGSKIEESEAEKNGREEERCTICFISSGASRR